MIFKKILENIKKINKFCYMYLHNLLTKLGLVRYQNIIIDLLINGAYVGWHETIVSSPLENHASQCFDVKTVFTWCRHKKITDKDV